MEVVAEGAETDSDAVELYQLGCEYAQGFAFGEPMDADAAMRLVDRRAAGSGELVLASLRGAKRRSNPFFFARARWIACGACHRARIPRDPLARNDGVWHRAQIHDLAARNARSFARKLSLENEGAGNAGGALHPRSRVQSCAKNAHTSIQFSGNTPASPAQWLYGLCRALLGDEFVLSPSLPA